MSPSVTPKARVSKKRAAARPAGKATGKDVVDAVADESVASRVLAALDDAKALDVKRLDVAHLTTVTDVMVFASGRSDRHVRAIADAVMEALKLAGHPAIGVEGQQSGEWVLVDFADVIVHVMLPRVREFYNIEKLWDIPLRERGDGD